MGARSGRQLVRYGRNADHTFGTAINLSEGEVLRLNAEERLLAQSSEVHSPHSETDIKKLGNELEVHQIELEMKNLEFRQTLIWVRQKRVIWCGQFRRLKGIWHVLKVIIMRNVVKITVCGVRILTETRRKSCT